ncbi:MAG: NFACT family protein [Thermosynechococcaceae cyanobacterium MS004]|nr:NFACT family protein [Thermosynechococcaceae cyanobacterium MS004]
MQQVDLTTLIALCAEVRSQWIPARLEQVYQCDRFTVKLALRTLEHRGWLTLCWHPQAARLGTSAAPPRSPDTFTFSQQLRHQLSGLVLVAVEQLSPWERVIDLQFAQRPQEPAQWHLYVEIMGKYSNVILATAENTIVTAAHQVSATQSSVRPIQTGQPYTLPPALTGPTPTLSESQESWQERLVLVPAPLKSVLLKTYRGVSSALVVAMLEAANLDPNRSVDTLTAAEWSQLFQKWQGWLTAIATQTFTPGRRSPDGYSVLGWGIDQSAESVQDLVEQYYSDRLNQQEFSQLRHQLLQKLGVALAKLRTKADVFLKQLNASAKADSYRQKADLLMAHLQDWQVGMKQIQLPDFETGQPVAIALDPERSAVQNAQALYKRHQKLKRARDYVTPLLAAVQQEIDYLEQVETILQPFEHYQTSADLQVLAEVREELIQQGYLADPDYRAPAQAQADFHRFRTPSGLEILIGRNNRQNELLTFRTASTYDLWFHTQEIPGSHVLLRLEAGASPTPEDLQYAANLAAYHSRARQSHQVPVVYTQPQHIYKPKGAKPGMVIYKHETILWGNPQSAIAGLTAAELLPTG